MDAGPRSQPHRNQHLLARSTLLHRPSGRAGSPFEPSRVPPGTSPEPSAPPLHPPGSRGAPPRVRPRGSLAESPHRTAQPGNRGAHALRWSPAGRGPIPRLRRREPRSGRRPHPAREGAGRGEGPSGDALATATADPLRVPGDPPNARTVHPTISRLGFARATTIRPHDPASLRSPPNETRLPRLAAHAAPHRSEPLTPAGRARPTDHGPARPQRHPNAPAVFPRGRRRAGPALRPGRLRPSRFRAGPCPRHPRWSFRICSAFSSSQTRR